MRRYLVGILFFCSSSIALGYQLDDLLGEVRRGNFDSIIRAYEMLNMPNNAEKSEALFMALEGTIDLNPQLLLSVSGLDFERFCDGIEFDLIDPTNDKLVKKQVAERIRRINLSKANVKVKESCIRKLKKIPACMNSHAGSDCSNS